MTHDEIREMLSADERTPAVEAHLRRCKACRTWDDTLATIRDGADGTFAEAPADLSDRVLTAVRTATVAGAAVATAGVASPSDAKVVSIWKHAGIRTAIAAAVAAAVAAVAVSIPQTGSDPVLVAAAKKTAQAKTAKVTMSSSFTFTPTKPIGLPRADLGQLSGELHTSLPPEMRELTRALAKARPQPAPIRKISSKMNAAGEVQFPDRLHLKGRGTEVASGQSSGEFETIVIGDKTWVRTPLFGKKWVRIPSFSPAIRLDFNPAYLVFGVQENGGRATLVGEERLQGERVKHYRFSDAKDFGGFIGERAATIDVWVGVSDGLLRKLDERHDGTNERGTIHARTVVQLTGFGSDVSIEAPSEADEMMLGELVAGFFGFGFGLAGGAFSYSFDAAAAMPAFILPTMRLPDFKFKIPELPQIKMPSFPMSPIPMPTFSFEGGGEYSWPSPSPQDSGWSPSPPPESEDWKDGYGEGYGDHGESGSSGQDDGSASGSFGFEAEG